MDVPGQTTKPTSAEANPKNQADEGDDHAENEQHLAHLVHAMVSLIPNSRFLKPAASLLPHMNEERGKSASASRDFRTIAGQSH
jgi:hypothetical protein